MRKDENMTVDYDEDGFGKLQEIFHDPKSQDKVKKMNIFVAFLGFLLIPVGMGLLVGLAFAPALTPIATVSNATTEYWNALPTDIPDIPPPQRSVILDAQDNVMAEIFSQNRIITTLDSVSPYVVDALLATEDRTFYEHPGYSVRGTLRALQSNFRGEDLQGASTLTQQLVKNTLVVNAESVEESEAATSASVFRKAEELKYAIGLEEKFTKEEILERYLNLVLYSNGVYGIGTAADYYFGLNASDLNLEQSALLIGLLKNPSGYDPINNPDRALQRRAVVLQNMVDNGNITQAEADAAKETPLNLNVQKPINGCSSAYDPYYCQLVVDAISNDPILGDTPEARQAVLYQGGLTIHTYFDAATFDSLQATADSTLGRSNRVATGIAVVEPGTGVVPAIAQNRTWGSEEDTENGLHTQVIYPDRVSFQSGSTFKVFTLAAALESGVPLDTVINAPGVYNPGYMNTPSGGITNISLSGTGTMDIATATARSSNTFYTVLQERIGVLTVADMADNLGLDVPREGPVAVGAKDSSFTLGTISVSPLQMAAAYATFAANGVYCEPRMIEVIYDVNDAEIGKVGDNCRQAVSPQTAAKVTYVLQGVVDGPDESRTGKEASLGIPVAGKTGTTNQQAAVWFVGYTPKYATAVWVGDPRGGQKYPLSAGFSFRGSWISNAYAGVVSAPIWQDVMSRLMANQPVQGFETPLAGSSVSNVIPNLAGMKAEDAINLLESRGYNVVVSEINSAPSEFLMPNYVAAQSPAAGTVTLIRDSTVTLTLSDQSSGFNYYYPNN